MYIYIVDLEAHLRYVEHLCRRAKIALSLDVPLDPPTLTVTI